MFGVGTGTSSGTGASFVSVAMSTDLVTLSFSFNNSANFGDEAGTFILSGANVESITGGLTGYGASDGYWGGSYTIPSFS